MHAKLWLQVDMLPSSGHMQLPFPLPQAVIVSPLFFGVAHFHHMVERIRKGEPVLPSLLISLFQVAIIQHLWGRFGNSAFKFFYLFVRHSISL